MSPFLLVTNNSKELVDKSPMPLEVVTSAVVCKLRSKWEGRFRRKPSRNSREMLRAVRLCTCTESCKLLQEDYRALNNE
jgi:hypothetical protein